MCGAPVFPAIPTRFAYWPQAAAAADVTDVGSPPPSTPSGWSSSLETGASPREHDTLAETYAAYVAQLSREQLMAEATRGLLLAAAQQQMARRRDRQAASTRGAPVVPPPIKMPFVVPNTMMPAADVMDAGCSAPSMPSHCSSSLETTPLPRVPLPPYLPDYAAAACASHYPLTQGTASGLAATKPPLPFPLAQQMARRPDRQASATRGAAPVPPPIKMRFVVPNTMMPAADVMDAGSSAPSTPSHCSSSFETTPSPRGPLPSPSLSEYSACASHHLTPAGAAWELATKTKPPMAPSLADSAAAPCASQHLTPGGAAWGGLATMPPLPFPSAPALRVDVRQVWAHNFEQEAKLIESLLPKFRYVAVDTEFPGTVYRAAGPAHTLKPEERYNLLRSTVDALDPVQLGLTLFDADCRLPSLGATATRYVWEFNFREFDVGQHRHAPETVMALRARGVDLDRTRRHGVDVAAAFGPRLRKWARAGLGRAGVVTASGGYDLAYLVKLMLGPGFRMPASAAEFEVVAGALLRRRRVFDVREMARRCPSDDLRGGMDSVAAKLNVARAAGEAHQTGYDSLLTCYTFMKLREICFDDDGKLTSVDGVLTEITAF